MAGRDAAVGMNRGGLGVAKGLIPEFQEAVAEVLGKVSLLFGCKLFCGLFE
jgi:hypothetical protein